MLKVKYSSNKVEQLCENIEIARKFFGGNEELAISLMARIYAIKNAQTIKDIIVQPAFRFHKLKDKGKKKLKGYFAIDVKTRKEPWRIILQPLNQDEQPFVPCNINEIAGIVKIVEIKEVSQHYE